MNTPKDGEGNMDSQDQSQAGVSLDTSGYALTPSIEPGLYNTVVWSDLSPFEQGYVEALVRETSAVLAVDRPAVSARGVHFSDLAPETLAAIRKDCAELVRPETFTFDPSREAGALCWRARQNEWGFYSGAIALHERFPPQTVTLGDDGKVRIAPVDGTTGHSSRSGRAS